MFKATHTSNMTVFLTIWQSNKKISCVRRIKQKHIHLLKLKLGFAMVFFLFASLDDRYVQLCLLWVLCVIRQLSVSLSVLSFHCLSVSQLSLHCLSVCQYHNDMIVVHWLVYLYHVLWLQIHFFFEKLSWMCSSQDNSIVIWFIVCSVSSGAVLVVIFRCIFFTSN